VQVWVIIFGSVRFLQKKTTKPKKRDPKPNRPVPVQFRSGFLDKKPDKPICNFWVLFGFLIGFLMGFVMGF
jgi:hypothetical protein